MIDFEAERLTLVDALRHRGIADERVLAAIQAVPRELFVPESLHEEAYRDVALPIAGGQTISQPFMVALMTQFLELQGPEKVLEVGTGSGYQTAVLAKLCDRIISIERLPLLAAEVEARLHQLGIHNVELHIGDGTLGWPAEAPYDRILVTAGAPDVPSPLYRQLALGGRLLVPVGSEESQMLQVITKRETGPDVHNAGACRFVKLIGDAGWEPASS